MKGYTLSLNYNYKRPVIKLYGIDTLIDTGAVIPVFSIPEELLKKSIQRKIGT